MFKPAFYSQMLLFFGAGIFLGTSNSILPWIMFVPPLLFFWVHKKGYHVLVLLILLFLGRFYFLCYIHIHHSYLLPNDQTSQNIIGTIQNIPSIDGDHLSFIYQMNKNHERIQVSYIIKSLQEKKQLEKVEAGFQCNLTGNFQLPEPQRNFFGSDYRLYLQEKGIYWVLQPSRPFVETCRENSAISLSEWLTKLRVRGIHYIETRYLPENAGLMNAFIFGYRDGIPADIILAYQKTGLTHLLAVSGFNVGILILIGYYLGVRLRFTKEKVYAALFILVPFYVLLTGAESSIVRAGLMGVAGLAGFRFKKRVSPHASLCFVCLVMLLYNPYYIFDLGFQLSFLMTFILFTSSGILELEENVFLKLIKASWMCQAVSFPVILHSFFEISPLSLPLNIIYIPFLSFIIFPLSFLVVILGVLLPPVGNFAAPFFIFLLNQSNNVLIKASSWSGMIVLGKPPFWLMIGYIGAIGWMFVSWEEKGKFKYRTCLPLFLVICLHYVWPYFNPNGSITFLDVGQGDSILVELPFRKAVYLIDTGGQLEFTKQDWQKQKEPYNVTKAVVMQYLKGMGIRKIDRFIITHSHADHAAGALNVLKEIKVETVMYSKHQGTTSIEKQVLQFANAHKMKTETVHSGQLWQAGQNASFRILSPVGDEGEPNAQSIVIWANIQGFSFLLTGDVEKEGEARIIRTYSNLHADVMKAGHHGSKTSSTAAFLQQVQPKAAVISVGAKNHYGHPDDLILKRYKDMGIKVYRTDVNGDIRITVKKSAWEIRTVKE